MEIFWHRLETATTNASWQTDLFGPCLISSTTFLFYPAVYIDDSCWTLLVCYTLSVTTLSPHLTLYCVKELYADCTAVRNHIVFIVVFDMMNNWTCAHNFVSFIDLYELYLTQLRNFYTCSHTFMTFTCTKTQFWVQLQQKEYYVRLYLWIRRSFKTLFFKCLTCV
jgi:hypothetical protein